MNGGISSIANKKERKLQYSTVQYCKPQQSWRLSRRSEICTVLSLMKLQLSWTNSACGKRWDSECMMLPDVRNSGSELLRCGWRARCGCLICPLLTSEPGYDRGSLTPNLTPYELQIHMLDDEEFDEKYCIQLISHASKLTRSCKLGIYWMSYSNKFLFIHNNARICKKKTSSMTDWMKLKYCK